MHSDTLLRTFSSTKASTILEDRHKPLSISILTTSPPSHRARKAMDSLCPTCVQIFTHEPVPLTEHDQAQQIDHASGSQHDPAPRITSTHMPGTILGGDHHSSARACRDAAVLTGCPICRSVWTKIIGLCADDAAFIPDPLALDYEDYDVNNDLRSQSAFHTSWEARLNGSDHESQKHWPTDRLVVRIQLLMVCITIGMDFVNSMTHGHVDFALEPIPCK
ncbi:hypothetical protein BD289DRAFT_203951 [Coniella lustricola]|uniref:Uncharacterized protein n=1 Tax=Coniella lustricola TaxID=2025994 RepID=A0A2T3ACE9_9PEZI|nr:hypothetical protein BD289DRAFT_203951 [Coniella lustricola]